MKIAIFGKYFSTEFKKHITELIDILLDKKVDIFIYKPFFDIIQKETDFSTFPCSFFQSPKESPDDIDFLISIGGDGTFLESILFLKSSDIPVIGLNTGRLGFLANIGRDEIRPAFKSILNQQYEIEERALLRIESGIKILGGYNFALNEVTVQKIDSSLLTIDAWINGEFLTSYWTDGLIISTPTGSTAYSLSVGGPIVVPGSQNFIVAPIASHNLSVRPLVVHEEVTIELEIKSRSNSFLVTADNRTQVLNMEHNKLLIRKTKFILKIVKLPFNSYYKTLRNKLMWGMDKRN